MGNSRWTPRAKYPLTVALAKLLPQSSRVATRLRADISSDRLCDDIIQRLSPYLRRNRPLDIIDLWPGGGLFSSKINDFLQPRRHVLVEPQLEIFEPLLKPLAKSKPCYELMSMDIKDFGDWRSFMSKHLPEQGPSNCDTTGALAKNNTLLVLANMSDPSSKKSHQTPARWWSTVMESCMRQTGLSQYGAVRLLALLPIPEAQAILPRSVSDRRRPSILTENVALHAVEVLATQDPGLWTTWKGLDSINLTAERVSKRAAEQNIVDPPERKFPPIPLAPESPSPGRKSCEHVPRIKYETHDKHVKAIEAGKKPDANDEAKRLAKRALSYLNQDNKRAFERKALVEQGLEIDELTRSLAREAAHPNSNLNTVKPLADEIAKKKSAFRKALSQTHTQYATRAELALDDERCVRRSENLEDTILAWDRRPFEPLRVDHTELYPHSERSMIYFEADANAPVMQKISQVPLSERGDLLRLFEAVSLSFTNRHGAPLSELLEALFPSRSMNEIVRAIPSLAFLASKTPKADFDNLPKTVHFRPEDQESGKQPDPAECFQGNLDYDFSDAHMRSLPAPILWDIILEYHRSPAKSSSVQLSRVLGASLTMFRTGEYTMPSKRLH